METVKILTGDQAVDAVRALYDANRRRILNALKARTMSASELVDFLAREDGTELKPQTVRYHLKELEKSGLIAQDGYEPAGNGDTHIMKKLWRATAETIFIAPGRMTEMPDTGSEEIEKSVDIVGTMKDLGFEIPKNGEIKDIVNWFSEWNTMWRKGRSAAEKTLQSLPELDPNLYVTLRRVLSIVRLDEQDYSRYWEVSRVLIDALRQAYREGAGKNPEVY